MKNLVNNYRAMPLHNKVLAAVYVLILLLLPFLLQTKAHAQAGTVYALPQAQVAGDTYEATVLQISIREVEPTVQARATGAVVGSALGLGLASQAKSKNRFAVNTVAAVLGGLGGERVANAVAHNEAQEIIVQLAPMKGQQPRIITIVQPAPFDTLVPGEFVYVSTIRGAWRVIRRPAPLAPMAPQPLL
jgi:outer membrane lipoprotein SlyB